MRPSQPQAANKRALVAAAASAVPVPGLDWAVDDALLSRLIPEISKEFGFTPSQLDQLDQLDPKNVIRSKKP